MPYEKSFDLMGRHGKIKLGMSMKDVGPVMKDLGKITLGDYVERLLFVCSIILRACCASPK